MSWGGKRPGAGRPRKIEPLKPEPIEEKSVNTLKTERTGFTDEEITQLKQSHYVRSVTTKTISYTLDFKNKFWEEYESGKSPPEIFADAGFDIDILGDTRMYGVLTVLRRTRERGSDFKDGREAAVQSANALKSEFGEIPRPPRLPPLKQLSAGSLDEKEMRRLLHQVAYLTQEMEFLKKIIAAETGGRSK